MVWGVQILICLRGMLTKSLPQWGKGDRKRGPQMMRSIFWGSRGGGWGVWNKRKNRSNFDLSGRWKMKCFASETWNDAMHHEMCYAHEMKFALLHMRFCAFHVPKEHFMAQPFHLPAANELPKANFIAHLRCAKLQFIDQQLSLADLI